MRQVPHDRISEGSYAAELLNSLRGLGFVNRFSSIALELIIGRDENRADLCVIDNEIHCYEIKTERDTLKRLRNQVLAYSLVSDRVTILVAEKHVKPALALIPSFIGVTQLRQVDGEINVITIREALISPNGSAQTFLSLLPVSEIKDRLLPSSKSRRRAELVSSAALIDPEKVRSETRSFLKERYSLTSMNFWEATKRRSIGINDLSLLRRWNRSTSNAESNEKFNSEDRERDLATYTYIGQSFGPVPEEITSLISY